MTCRRCGTDADENEENAWYAWDVVHECGHKVIYRAICDDHGFSSPMVASNTSAFMAQIGGEPCPWCGGQAYKEGRQKNLHRASSCERARRKPPISSSSKTRANPWLTEVVGMQLRGCMLVIRAPTSITHWCPSYPSVEGGNSNRWLLRGGGNDARLRMDRVFFSRAPLSSYWQHWAAGTQLE